MARFAIRLKEEEEDEKKLEELQRFKDELEAANLSPSERIEKFGSNIRSKEIIPAQVRQGLSDLEQGEVQKKLRGFKSIAPRQQEISQARAAAARANPASVNDRFDQTDIIEKVTRVKNDPALEAASLDAKLEREALSLGIKRAKEWLKFGPDQMANVSKSKFGQGGIDASGDPTQQRGFQVGKARETLASATTKAPVGFDRGVVRTKESDVQEQKDAKLDEKFLGQFDANFRTAAFDKDNPNVGFQAKLSNSRSYQNLLDEVLESARLKRRKSRNFGLTSSTSDFLNARR